MYSNAFFNLLNDISNFSSQNKGHIWYRGVSKNTYKLDSGLFRLNFSTLDEYLNLERQEQHYINVNSNLLNINKNEYTDLEKLYLMQHHGLKTRLLDWTSNIGIALYFLSLEWTSDTPSRLWMINPTKLNMISKKKEGIISPYEYNISDIMNLDHSIAIYPIRNNNRIIAQHGYFTVQGNSLKSLDDEFKDTLVKDNALYYKDLTFDLKADVINYLSMSDINSFSIFPDIYGLKEYIDKTLIPQTVK